ncbi:MAG: gliding motility lipoprotein GldD [Chitinophagaceae bacterium]
MYNRLILSSLFVALIVCGCNSSYTPKPRGYFAIDFPEKKYQTFQQQGYPYSFEYPIYAKVIKDSTFFGEASENPWWINIQFPQFNGTLHISYKSIGTNNFDKLINDAFKLTNKHTSRATSINDSVFTNANGVSGVFFNVGGDVATANQFFVTDSTKHFLRGALYFDASPNQDSLSIINQFLVKDMLHLINSFQWKK